LKNSSDFCHLQETAAGTVFPAIKRAKGKSMPEELKNSTALAPIGDGLDGYNDSVEGAERSAGQGLIRGTLLKFGNTAEWETKDGEVLDHDTNLIAIDIIRAVVKWGADKKAETTIVVPPGQPFPDVEAMNEAIPKKEWRQGLNGPQGPWQTQQMVVLLDPRTMEQFTYATSAVGGFIAIRDLADKVKAMRRYRGPVSPIITLGDVHMKTRFGDRRRPHFTVVDWVRMNGEAQQAALPAPQAAPEPAQAEPVQVMKPAEPVKVDSVKAEPVKGKYRTRSKGKAFAIGDKVAPLATEEELNDAVPF
jgi:hypothetical protein